MNPARRFFKLLWKDKWALTGATVLTFWLVVALVPQFFPELQDVPMELSARLSAPSKEFLLGVNDNGNSVALLLMNGARTSLMVSLFTVGMSLLVGIPLGAAAGFFGGWVDGIVSRLIDILLSFPPLILPIAITAFFGGGLLNVVVALSVTGWVSYARLVRGQFLSIREREFVTAARSLGAGDLRLMFSHILPNTLSPLAVQATFALAGVIISEAGLSFLGLGVNQSHTSWGGLLNDARSFLTEAPFLAFFPALALFSVVSSLNFLGEALRLAFDPRSLSQAGRV
ncbi:MAG: ABC transporter permease [Silvanigrellales bacterium]|jgi:peptide/nickel transport system permease protein|nr:ABC transporter permease [Silvanigrellales bacterium]